MPVALVVMDTRFIPAWAGNTSLLSQKQMAKSVHPRVGGEHKNAILKSWKICGSSPRGRGTHCASFPI